MKNGSEAKLLYLLKSRGLTLSLAESCTGGLAASLFVSQPGASEVFWGSFVSYANEAKAKMLSVDPKTIESMGAVSEAVVKQMALGALRASGTDTALSFSGIAGPSGATSDKPVGSVWICAALKDIEPKAEFYLFKGNRNKVRKSACEFGFRMLLELLR